MLLLQLLGQHWQMAQAAEPKQQAAVLAREMMAPILQSHRVTVWKYNIQNITNILSISCYFPLRDSSSLPRALLTIYP